MVGCFRVCGYLGAKHPNKKAEKRSGEIKKTRNEIRCEAPDVDGVKMGIGRVWLFNGGLKMRIEKGG